MTNKEAFVALSTFIPFGPRRVKLLISYFGSAKKVWTASKKRLIETGLGQEKVENFCQHKENFDIEGYFNKLKRLSIEVLTKDDKDYPQRLLEITDAPFVLYVKGEIKVLNEDALAIVGSRKMTSYGAEVTEKFASEFANYGLVIVSGLARGIDTTAHKVSLEVGGKTVAVLGCGLDSIYPPENTNLAKDIVQKGGALISEYPLGYPALPVNFAARNRIISGISRALVVIEGAEKSGTLLTASSAADQGRSVFAIPGQITSPLSAAPLFLIKNGAKMATCAADILEELDLEVKVDRQKVEKILPSDKKEGVILEFLENEPRHLDELARASSLDVSYVSARLTIMELKGLVKNLGGGVYKRI